MQGYFRCCPVDPPVLTDFATHPPYQLHWPVALGTVVVDTPTGVVAATPTAAVMAMACTVVAATVPRVDFDSQLLSAALASPLVLSRLPARVAATDCCRCPGRTL